MIKRTIDVQPPFYKALLTALQSRYDFIDDTATEHSGEELTKVITTIGILARVCERIRQHPSKLVIYTNEEKEQIIAALECGLSIAADMMYDAIPTIQADYDEVHVTRQQIGEYRQILNDRSNEVIALANMLGQLNK